MSLREVRILRFAFGTGVSVAFAYGLEYSISFLSTVLVAAFLGTPAPNPGARGLAAIAASIVVAFAFGIAMSLVVLPSPLVYFLALGLVLFRIFYAAMGGAPSFIVLMVLIGVTMIPVLGTQSQSLSLDFAVDFFWAASIGFVWIGLAHAVLPDPPAPSDAPAPEPPPAPSDAECLRAALGMVALVLPLAVVIVSLQWTDQLRTLLYVAILSMKPAALRAGAGMMAGTLIGGAAALLVYVLTSIHHSWLFLVLLVLWILLLLGRRIFSDGPRATLFAGAPPAFLILISSTESAFGEETDEPAAAHRVDRGRDQLPGPRTAPAGIAGDTAPAQAPRQGCGVIHHGFSAGACCRRSGRHSPPVPKQSQLQRSQPMRAWAIQSDHASIARR